MVDGFGNHWSKAEFFCGQKGRSTHITVHVTLLVAVRQSNFNLLEVLVRCTVTKKALIQSHNFHPTVILEYWKEDYHYKVSGAVHISDWITVGKDLYVALAQVIAAIVKFLMQNKNYLHL